MADEYDLGLQGHTRPEPGSLLRHNEAIEGFIEILVVICFPVATVIHGFTAGDAWQSGGKVRWQMLIPGSNATAFGYVGDARRRQAPQLPR